MLEEGLEYVKKVGSEKLQERDVGLVHDLSFELVDAGVSLGVLPVQKLAQMRPEGCSALFFSCLPSGEWAFGPWPDSVPVHINGMNKDHVLVDEGDIQAAREIVEKPLPRSFSFIPVINTCSSTIRWRPTTSRQ